MCKAFFEGSGLAFGDFATDLPRERFALAAGREVTSNILIPRRFFHLLKPASELPSFLLRQMLDRFLDGFERHTVNVT